MPSKKRSYLSYRSANAKRLRLLRESETQEETEIRLQNTRRRQVERIASESTSETLDQLRSDRERRAEPNEYLSQRLQNDQRRHSLISTSGLKWKNKLNSGFNYNININYLREAEVGNMDVVCNFCKALKWKDEPTGLCCLNGKVRLAPIVEPPGPLKSLLNGTHDMSRQFLDNIRTYNAAFNMTSFGAKEIRENGYMPTFKVQGQVYHTIGSLLPVENSKEVFLQIYFIADYIQQRDTRLALFPELNTDIVGELQNMLHQINPYVKDFKTALESMPSDCNSSNYKIVINADKKLSSEHAGRHNEPATNEVSVVLVDQHCDSRDIVLQRRDKSLQRICETHRSYDALQYPLIFCRGEDGYSFANYQVDPQTGQKILNKKITSLQYYCYRIMMRKEEYNHIHLYKQLYSQYLVDMYAKIETERLRFLRTHQSKLRVENYIHLRDAVTSDESTDSLGRLVILPSTFTGGPRYLHERTQDAFVYVRKYGRPDLFITFTTNPKWAEITQELLAGQTAADRHDIVARVFKQKLKLLMHILIKSKIYGPVLCNMYTVEWQKRGLPHAHVLIWLENRIQSNQINDVICAEIPNKYEDPKLFDIVKTHMVHGPCGAFNNKAPCMKDGHCTKKFPKQFLKETTMGEDSYPLYRRRSPQDGGNKAVLGNRNKTVEVDNRWIVPYSPVLSRTFQAHINVELCSSVKSIKYICKYINKGSDLAVFSFKNESDEITSYQSGRYISTSEAVWRILSYSIHERFPPVMHLDVHLENGQRVYFNTDQDLQNRLDNLRNTTLLAFFSLCQTDLFARTLVYEEVPAFFTFNKQNGTFSRRRRGTPVDGHPGVVRDHVLGRVYTIHPSNYECYYLRMLLHVVKGPTSFERLKTVNGVVHQTYQAACLALGLLEDDSHWHQTLTEASVSCGASKLRELFAIILVFCNVSNPLELWETFQENFSEDILRDISRHYENFDINNHKTEINNRTLVMLQDVLVSLSGKTIDKFGLPTPQVDTQFDINREYIEQLSYDSVQLQYIIETCEPQLNPEQRKIYKQILESIQAAAGSVYCLDAPGGTGKTFLINLILSKVRKEKRIALAVASSGIAATLLPGGKTAHSLFKIPIDADRMEYPVCSISKNSQISKVLQECVFIVWDECAMAHKASIEAVDRTLQDLRNDQRPFGGVTVLFSGDFRQILPVVNRGTRADEVTASIKRSVVWRHVQKLQLTKNMRANTGNGVFAQILLELGEGKIEHNDNMEIILPKALCEVVEEQNLLIKGIYPDLENLTSKEDTWFCERSILAPKNDQVDDINNKIIEMIPGDIVTYRSIDTVCNQSEVVHYPVEFLNSIRASGLPHHNIHLKTGVPIILMRNLHPPKLCNGTRLRVTALQQNIVEATILTGCAIGENVFIPRIPIIPKNYPFEFKRLQFPINLCFSMTINKAQGQTFSEVGVDLSKSCFSHGQLYVACSRVSDSTKILVLAPARKTRNVVYKEALL